MESMGLPGIPRPTRRSQRRIRRPTWSASGAARPRCSGPSAWRPDTDAAAALRHHSGGSSRRWADRYDRGRSHRLCVRRVFAGGARARDSAGDRTLRGRALLGADDARSDEPGLRLAALRRGVCAGLWASAGVAVRAHEAQRGGAVRVLAGDIGGTNARLAIVDVDGRRARVEGEQRFASQDAPGLAPLVRRFLGEAGRSLEWACFAVAGRVIDGVARTSNLPWPIDERALAAAIGI